MTNPAIFRKLVGDAITEPDIVRFGDLKEECYRDVARGKVVLMDGVHALIDALTDRGVALAIGTSGPRANMRLTVESCGLDGRFAAIAALEDITRSKPDPEVFLLAAKLAGVDPASAFVFEDAPIGIQAAKSAGMYAVGVTSTRPADALRDAGADEVVDTLDAYPVDRLIDRLRSRKEGRTRPQI
jgi:HAD superfamily hydrolase (TIGR01509 family)